MSSASIKSGVVGQPQQPRLTEELPGGDKLTSVPEARTTPGGVAQTELPDRTSK